MAAGRALLLASLVAFSSLGTFAVADHPRGGSDRLVSFDHKTGNEWWVEAIVKVEGSGSLQRVEASDDDRAWHTLTLRSWGAWAASFHIEPGNRVIFRATMDNGEVIYSCWFTHPAGVEQCDPSEPSPENSQVRFDHRGGNEWWVEVDVQAHVPPDEVYVRDGTGDWTLLSYKSWGVWAGNHHVEPGNEVRFRALAHGSTADIYDVQSCWYSHPGGVARCPDTPPPPPSPFTFRHGGGNEWWVEAKIDPRPSAVEAMDTDGSWKALSFKSWGEWAGSFRIEQGHEVKFRAKGADATWHESCWFSHPAGVERCPTPPPSSDEWPREGSYVDYSANEIESYGRYADEWTYTLRFRYEDGHWHARCVGSHVSEDRSTGVRTLEDEFDVLLALAPPTGPTDPAPGQTVHVGSSWQCVESIRSIEVKGTMTHPASREGEPVQAPAWRGTRDETGSCDCGHDEAHWSRDVGIILSWDRDTLNVHTSLEIMDTDAPIGPDDAYEPTPAPAWPREGSYVEVEQHYWTNYSAYEIHSTTRFEHRDGRWTFHCTSTTVDDGEVVTSTPSGLASPLFAPLAADAGDEIILPGGAYGTMCVALFATLVVEREVTLDGRRVMLADETPEDDAAGEDSDAWYDKRHGLVLQWEHRNADRTSEWTGRVLATDAPLG